MRRFLGLAVDAMWIAFAVLIVVIVIGLMLGAGDL
jgi:hypothetical protein